MPSFLRSAVGALAGVAALGATAAPVEAQTPPTTVADTEDHSEAPGWVSQVDGMGWSIGSEAGEAATLRAAQRSTREHPVRTEGHGDGSASDCDWVPIGPLDQVVAAQAAVNANQMPNVADPAVDGALADVPGVIEMTGGRTTWYRVTGTTAQVQAKQLCNGVLTDLDWFDLVPDGAGGLALQVSAADLVPGAFAQVVRRLPTPQLRVGPADENPDGFAYVNNPTFFWLDQVAGQWAVVSGTASAGSVSVTVQAAPVQLVVDPGDGNEPVRCERFRPVLRRDVGPSTELSKIADGCSYRYRDSSSMASNGETWPVTGSIVWHATWTASTGEGGDLGYVTTTSAVRDLPVAEVQAVIVDTHTD
jgi:hypothetical protein